MNLDGMSDDQLLSLYNEKMVQSSTYKTREQALKILINSLYGA